MDRRTNVPAYIALFSIWTVGFVMVVGLLDLLQFLWRLFHVIGKLIGG